ncbi:MAG TPA: DUF2807 domain-containing protein, partial [Duganella sp.]|nr:DUF2807 domain-containing protein [Duganella sp.]
MNRTIKHRALACTLLAAAIAGGFAQADNKQDDNKQDAAIGTETRTVAPFTGVNLIGPFRVIVTSQGGNGIELTGPRKKLAEIETSVSGDTLTVRQPRKKSSGWVFNFSWNSDHKSQVTVRINAATLKSLRNGGSGDVDLQQFQGQTLSLTSDGAGDIHANGTVTDLTVTSSGSGDLDLRTLKAGNLNLVSNGPGDIQAAGVTQDLNISVNGPGDLDIGDISAGKVNTAMHGPGSVTLRGSAREIRAEVAGPGDLDACSLSAEAASAMLHGP